MWYVADAVMLEQILAAGDYMLIAVFRRRTAHIFGYGAGILQEEVRSRCRPGKAVGWHGNAWMA